MCAVTQLSSFSKRAVVVAVLAAKAIRGTVFSCFARWTAVLLAKAPIQYHQTYPSSTPPQISATAADTLTCIALPPSSLRCFGQAFAAEKCGGSCCSYWQRGVREHVFVHIIRGSDTP